MNDPDGDSHTHMPLKVLFSFFFPHEQGRSLMYPGNVKRKVRAHSMIVSEQIPVTCVSKAPMEVTYQKINVPLRN